MIDEPCFYTPEADTAAVVRCKAGHIMLRETAQQVGAQNYQKWGCPYCLYSSAERARHAGH